jgi:hypothetical protein
MLRETDVHLPRKGWGGSTWRPQRPARTAWTDHDTAWRTAAARNRASKHVCAGVRHER